MQLIRTTVRLHPQIKKAADKRAVDLDITFQALLEKALKAFLNQKSRKQAQKIVFKDRNIGTPLDHLDREALYAD
ncbi:MAG: hypothetical protein WAU07_05545 [Microgenomates group bacterium]